MANEKLIEIRKQMAALEKEEAKLLKKNRTSALREIKRMAELYKLSAADLTGVLVKSKRGRKPGSTVAKKRGRPPGSTSKATTGKRRGRKPKAPAAE
ncbi:MAG TPA: H-NS family nucleoid-associated regulatory protein [Hyphomicrobiales bacterium]|nr:H-NS family nucleoid-associated regulatory protein [Hyphomicrobiales bacterium]